LTAIKVLGELAKAKAAGPSPSFTKFHLLKAFRMVGEEGPIGRVKLSRRLLLGEGAARTLVDHLRLGGFIKIGKAGCMLTGKGLRVLRDLNSKLQGKGGIPRSSLSIGAFNYGFLVKGAGHKIRYGIEQRDAAVRAGARGAITIKLSRGKLYVPPPSKEMPKDWGEFSKRIMQMFNPSENDVIIISGADSEEKAEQGAFSAALTLLEEK